MHIDNGRTESCREPFDLLRTLVNHVSEVETQFGVLTGNNIIVATTLWQGKCVSAII